MSRIKIGEQQEELTNTSLEELARIYLANKIELDSYEAICKDESTQIKQKMLELGIDDFSIDGKVLKRVVTHKTSVNSELLLAVVKKYNIPGVVRTIEVVDSDALESYIYNNMENLPENFSEDISKCSTETEIVQLRVGKAKKKED